MNYLTPLSITLGQKATFYPEITKNLMFEKCEFCEKWDFEKVNFVKTTILKMWILRKMRLWKCEFGEKWGYENMFCEKIDFVNVNFVKNEILQLWI